MNKSIVAIAIIVMYSLTCASLSTVFLGNLSIFWVSFVGIAGGLFSNIIAGVLQEEALNLRQLRPLYQTIQGLRPSIKRMCAMGFVASLVAALLILGSFLQFVDFRNVGKLNGFPRDLESVVYVIDNSGSMGCKDKDGFKLDNGYCSRAGNYKVRLAKEWIQEDFSSLDAVKQVSVIEIGGLTTEDELETCKLNDMTVEDSSLISLNTILDSIQANSSGATNISGAIIRAVDKVGSLKGEKQQIIVISDLGHNCGEVKVKDISSELEGIGWNREDLKNAMHKIAIFSLSSSSKEGTREGSSKAELDSLRLSDGASLDRQAEIQALRSQGVRVIELKNFSRLERLSVPSGFNFTLWQIFFISLSSYVILQTPTALRQNNVASKSTGLALRRDVSKHRKDSQVNPSDERKNYLPSSDAESERSKAINVRREMRLKRAHELLIEQTKIDNYVEELMAQKKALYDSQTGMSNLFGEPRGAKELEERIDRGMEKMRQIDREVSRLRDEDFDDSNKT